MNRFSRPLFCAAIAALLLPFVALAEPDRTFTERVRYKPEFPFIGYIGLDDALSCKTLVSDVKLTTPAKHGKVTIKKDVVVAAFPAQCRGLKFTRYAVIYKPDSGFHGRDEAVVTFKVPIGRTEKLTWAKRYIIRVK